MTAEPHYEVVIAGFGPAGAVAACWLGQHGVKTLVVEKSLEIWNIPRAIALDHEIMRVFQNIGVVKQVLPHTAPFGASEHFGAQGQLIRRIDVVAPPYPMGYLPNMVFTQPRVEAILRRRAAEHPSVTVRFGAEVTGLAEQRDAVAITLRKQDGCPDVIRTKYLIACDGASSTVRRLLSIPLEDLGFDEPWLVVDLLVNDDALPKLPQVCAQFCDPARPCTYIIGPANHRRWEIMLNPGEDPRSVEREENVWRLLSRWLAPGEGKLWRASSYRFHALVAAQWRRGRVFLAGDSAHQQPPFLGQGIRDVTNLCWKLASVLCGDSGDTLLDTYQEERKQHVTTLSRRIKDIGASICIRNPETARERDAILLSRGGGKAPVVTRQEIVPPLQTGLIRPDLGPGAGTLFPQPQVMADTSPCLLDEFSGIGWRLIIDGRRQTTIAESAEAGINTITIGDTNLREVEEVAAAWFDAHGCRVAIVRPDHYVYCGLADPNQARTVWSELRDRIRKAGAAPQQDTLESGGTMPLLRPSIV